MAEEKAQLGSLQMTSESNEVMRLLRTLEERIANLNRTLEVIENNFLAQQKRMNKDFLLAESDLVDMKKELSKFDYKMNLFTKELSLCARKIDVDTLKKYLEFWQPTDFIRKKEAEQFIQQKKQVP